MIAETAVIHSSAALAEGISIGHYSVIGEDVTIGKGTTIGSHVVIEGPTTIGERNTISHHAAIGGAPQDLKYRGEPTRLEIGDENTIREFTTLHRGSVDGGGVTRIGSRNLIMAYVHIAHDCRVGNDIVIANAVNMAGHVTINDFVIIGGICAIHQFVRIGRYAFIGGFTAVSQDVVPFGLMSGDRGSLRGTNKVGLKRRGFDPQRRQRIHTAVRYLINQDMNLKSAVSKIKEEFADDPDISELLTFIESSERGIC